MAVREVEPDDLHGLVPISDYMTPIAWAGIFEGDELVGHGCVSRLHGKAWAHDLKHWGTNKTAVVQLYRFLTNRERGVLMLSTTGRLLKLTDGVGTDSGGLVKWQYESPWMTGPRARVLSVYSVTQGAPTFRLYSDDGAGSVDTYDANSPHTMTVELDEGRFTPLPASNLPGVRHKIIVSGVCGRDKVKYLGLGVQPDGTDQLGS